MLQRPFVQGIILFLFYEFYIRYPHVWLFLIPTLLIIIGYLFWWWIDLMRDQKERHWYLFYLSLLFVFATILAIATSENNYTRHVIAVCASVLHLLFALYARSIKGDIRARPPLLVHSATLLVTIFLFFSGGFFHAVQFQFAVRNIMPFILIFTVQLCSVILYLKILRVSGKKIIITSIASLLIIIETFWVVEFLPHAVFTRSILQMIPLVLFVTFERDRLLEQFDSKRALKRAGIALMAMIIILFITRWS